MIKSRVARKIAASRSPRLWRAAAFTAQVGRTLSPNDRLWNARIGYALRRAGRLDAAIQSYAAAIAGDAAGDWVDIATLADDTSQANRARAQWYYDLGSCLLMRKEPEAVSIIRIACERDPRKIKWLERLALLEKRFGNPYGLAWAEGRLLDAREDFAPNRTIELASQYEELGLWMDAQESLSEVIRHDPSNAWSHRLLARVALTSQLWGGTFVDPSPPRSTPLFQFGAEPVIPPTHALERAATLNPSNTRWRTALGEALIANCDYSGALERFDAGLREADASNERWALGVKQRWQFQLERCHYQLGKARVHDPLFACTATPAGSQATGIQEIAGLFGTRLSYLGLTISGLVTSKSIDHVRVVLNGTTIRSIKVSNEHHLPRFSITLKRTTMALLPKDAILEVCTDNGERLRAPHGFERIDLVVPHGDGQLLNIVSQSGKLSKKGQIDPSPEVVEERQLESLAIYARLRKFLSTEMDRDVFLMYGTLLGYFRDGDFIPGDDDFDAAYMSDKTNPSGVKREAQDIILKLVRAGFGVSFNWRGRLMRVHSPGGPATGAHVDFRPLWFQHGRAWAHNHLCMPASIEDVLPVVEGQLRGVQVSIPRNTEAFLLRQYGPGWKVPDPGFAYHLGDVDQEVRKNLNRALITAGEYKDLMLRIDHELNISRSTGKLVALGASDLYPLTHAAYEVDLD